MKLSLQLSDHGGCVEAVEENTGLVVGELTEVVSISFECSIDSIPAIRMEAYCRHTDVKENFKDCEYLAFDVANKRFRKVKYIKFDDGSHVDLGHTKLNFKDQGESS